MNNMRSIVARRLTVLAVLTAAFLVPFGLATRPAHAQATQSPPPAVADSWQFAAAPYAWFAGMKGKAATLPPAPAISLDVSFSDILENLDVGAMLLAEARHGRFIFMFDLLYLDLGAKANSPGPGIFFTGVDLNLTSLTTTLTGSYVLVEQPDGFLAVLAGARLWSVGTELKFTGGLLGGRKAKSDEVWVDPIIGIRGRLNLGSGLFANLYADIGGFGIGSDLTWQVYGGLGYEFSTTWSAFAGYRYLSVDYKKGGYLFDVDISGPMLGAIFRF